MWSHHADHKAANSALHVEAYDFVPPKHRPEFYTSAKDAPLPRYDFLRDPYMAPYFNRPRVRKVLLQHGIIHPNDQKEIFGEYPGSTKQPVQITLRKINELIKKGKRPHRIEREFLPYIPMAMRKLVRTANKLTETKDHHLIKKTLLQLPLDYVVIRMHEQLCAVKHAAYIESQPVVKKNMKGLDAFEYKNTDGNEENLVKQHILEREQEAVRHFEDRMFHALHHEKARSELMMEFAHHPDNQNGQNAAKRKMLKKVILTKKWKCLVNWRKKMARMRGRFWMMPKKQGRIQRPQNWDRLAKPKTPKTPEKEPEALFKSRKWKGPPKPPALPYLKPKKATPVPEVGIRNVSAKSRSHSKPASTPKASVKKSGIGVQGALEGNIEETPTSPIQPQVTGTPDDEPVAVRVSSVVQESGNPNWSTFLNGIIEDPEAKRKSETSLLRVSVAGSKKSKTSSERLNLDNGGRHSKAYDNRPKSVVKLSPSTASESIPKRMLKDFESEKRTPVGSKNASLPDQSGSESMGNSPVDNLNANTAEELENMVFNADEMKEDLKVERKGE